MAELMSTNVSLISTTPYLQEQSTRWMDTKEYAKIRDLAVNISNGIAGLMILSFNVLMLLLYIRRPKIRKSISFMMLQVFIFCALQGLEVGTIFVLHRVYRYQMPIWYCVTMDIFMQMLDDYVLMLLPLLAIERLLHLSYPFLSQKKAKRWAIISTIVAVCITTCTSAVPLIPNIGIAESFRLTHGHQEIAKRKSRFYFYFSCQGYLNKRNVATPIIMLILQIMCVVVVVGIYIKMYTVAKMRLTKFSGLTEHKRKKLRRAAISVLLVAIVFILTTWPFGLTQTLRGMCAVNYIDPKSHFCQNIGLELRFAFGIISHLGFMFAPMVFALFNPKIRKALAEFLRCGIRKNISSRGTTDSIPKDVVSSNNPTSNEYNHSSTKSLFEYPLRQSPVKDEDMPFTGVKNSDPDYSR